MGTLENKCDDEQAKEDRINCFHPGPVLPCLLIVEESLKNLILIWNNSNLKTYCGELSKFKKKK